MEQELIRRLRVKFIVINMALAFVVLLVTFGTVCALNYANSVNSINSHLSYVLTRTVSALSHPSDQVGGLQELERLDVAPARISVITPATSANNNEGPANSDRSGSREDEALEDVESVDGIVEGERDVEPATETAGDAAGNTASEDAEDSEGAATEGADATETDDAAEQGPATVTAPNKSVSAPTIGSGQGSSNVLTAVFEVSKDGIYTTVPAYTTATIPDSILLRADDAVIRSPTVRGYLPEFDLMFEKLSRGDGWLVAYANASSTHAWKHLAVLLAIVGLIALVVFFLINILFSRWATRPVALSFRRQQQFTADASHELKTPLTVILANLSILRSHADSTVAEQMQWVESTETEAERMQLLVNDMLSLARHESAKVGDGSRVNGAPLDFTDLVEGEVLQFESVAFERGILVDSRLEENVCVLGDAEKLGRMVSTLIDNACKYVEANGLVDVTLSTEERSAISDGKACLRVHNTGEAIAPEDLEHLFDRFYRADKARTGGKGGYGLGLAIGQQIAHEHGGEISVTSSPEEGTTFTVTLPLNEQVA